MPRVKKIGRQITNAEQFERMRQKRWSTHAALPDEVITSSSESGAAIPSNSSPHSENAEIAHSIEHSDEVVADSREEGEAPPSEGPFDSQEEATMDLGVHSFVDFLDFENEVICAMDASSDSVDEVNMDDGSDSECDDVEACAFGLQAVDYTFALAESDYESDEANNNDGEHPEQFQFVPHGMNYHRKHGMLFDVVDGRVQLVRYDGRPNNIWQVVGVPYLLGGRVAEITVGITTHVHPMLWAHDALDAANSGIKHPSQTGRTKGCRSVRDAILRTDRMATELAFPFFLFGRGRQLMEQVKGIVRRATDCEHNINSPDCVGAWIPFYEYIFNKIVNAVT